MQRKFVAALMAALLSLLLVIQPALAAAPLQSGGGTERHFRLACEAGVCRAELDLGLDAALLPHSGWLSIAQGALRQLPGGLGFEVQDDVTITLLTGTLALANADLVMTLDENGKVATLRGSAMAPVPTFGLLGDWQVVTPGRVSVGYDRGDQLAEFNAPLQADRRYFFVDVEAGLHLATQGLALDSAAGQRATLIVDFAQPLVYVDGHVTLHTDGQMAFIREALGPAAESGWLPTDLPLRQSVSLQLQGQVGRDVEPSLTLAGEYRMDSGMVGKWLQLEATPLLATGQATIAPEGVVVEGMARSTLLPQQWFDGGAQAQLFVPFATPDAPELHAEAEVAMPALGVDEAAATTLQAEAGWMARAGENAWAGVQQGWNQMGATAQDGYARLGEGVGTGWAATQVQWCVWTNLCAEENGTRVAAAEEP